MNEEVASCELAAELEHAPTCEVRLVRSRWFVIVAGQASEDQQDHQRWKASNRYAWLRWIVTGNLPLSFCESKKTRQYTKLTPISVETLTAIMEAVTKAMETMIGDTMPERFGLVLDGWTHGTEHYMAVYGCFETATGPQYPLLSLAPVMDEPDDRLSADGHLTAIKRFLPFFGKSISGCLFLVGDNCGVNKRLANLLGVPLIGCASHRLNLAVRDYLEPHDSILEEIQQLMLPRPHWPLSSDRTSAGRRPFQPFISADDEELADFLPSRSAHRKLETLLASLRDVESVSKHLQGDGLTLLDARVLFDELLKSHPSFANYLATDADIVHSAVFVQAVVKVLDDQAALLTDDEVAALEPFKRTQDHVEGVDCTPADKEGFAVRALKRRKVAAASATYELLNAIPPTSNMAERLFSIARAMLRHERHHLSPMMLEMILFLKINSSYWDVATVE
ncbi:hypothetical protein PHYSODRAFT_337039 [Phytophthora sojae]|uniref:HAT C-terminal dimerisation domain-containing protein n=1 Tax=Phytophthora sojae (strain P6497) TaxID=1094619 RepID=G4ZXQ6_PHYSP|nr:hypothetical protein PHYSODRAFT_337039 [Phytophthora sojae]EGZ12619.1 hypothetical protein PHYSODRAFT_337039 [Phytophthora sojae]|eukprot:XP_009532952.1 hypothetical protein PHYSODRAFT_337039 [Phytophthora sojae]